MIKRLGIFGGAFDPVHKGHTQSLKFINDLKIVDEVYVIPNFASPHDKDIRSSGSHRLKMLEMAFNEFENIKINEFELNNKKKSYSYETLNSFKQLFPDRHFSLIIGLDSLHSFTTWKNWEEILSLCSLLVLGRTINKNKKLDKALESRITLDIDDFFSEHGKIFRLGNDFINVSSSEIRKKIKNDESLEGLLDQNVQEYIQDMSLYKN
mgnify:FL=1|tara:strand:+ start:673 stop:1299 length:627 start_codon:yes stop_codon:yes gene_type:complete